MWFYFVTTMHKMLVTLSEQGGEVIVGTKKGKLNPAILTILWGNSNDNGTLVRMHAIFYQSTYQAEMYGL